MDNEPYRDMTHQQIADTLAGYLEGYYAVVEKEKRLANGRIADIWAISTDGISAIFEVKTKVSWSIIRNAQMKYQNSANCLFIASNHAYIDNCGHHAPVAALPTGIENVGIIQVQWEGVRLIKPANYRARPNTARAPHRREI